MTTGYEPTLLAVMAKSRPTRAAVTAMLAAIGFLAFVATALGAGLVHAHVTTGERIAYLHERVGTVEGIQSEDHDRLARIEAQLEYVAKLSLLQINEERAEKGKPLVPDEFPRDE